MSNIVTTVLSPLIVGIAQSALKSLAKTVWETLWSLLIDSIGQVEYSVKNNPALKKETVIKKVMEYIKAHKKFNGVQLWAIEKFVEKIIEKMVDEMNANYGHGWREYIVDLKKYWENRIPYLK